jgi:phosphotriesterase-related protein
MKIQDASSRENEFLGGVLMAKLSTEWAEIPTFSGLTSPDNLGIVSLGEYLLYGLPGWWYAPEVKFDRAVAFDQILSSLNEFKALGGGTVVDTSGITLGRDATFYSRLAQMTDVKIVAATGFDNEFLSIPIHFGLYGWNYYVSGPFEPLQKGYYGFTWQRDVPGSFYPQHGATKEYLMFLFYNELVRGMIAPGMIRTQIKAGIVKTGATWEGISRVEELSIRAAAVAAKRTGTSVIANGVNQAKAQMEIMLEERLAPERILIGHCDDARAIDLQRDREMAEKGAYIAYDHIGWEDASVPHSVPDERRVELVKSMVEAGFTEHLILSCGAIGYAIDVPQPRHSFSHLFKSFVPKLQKAGIGDSTIDTILRENPKRLLTRRESSGG